MTVMLELTLEEAAALTARADAAGVGIDALLHGLIASLVSQTEPEHPAATAGPWKTILPPAGAGTSDDPEERAEREREAAEMQNNIRRWRAEQGHGAV